MNLLNLCDAVRQGMPALYECSSVPVGGVRIRTPFLYPDGGVVDVFVVEANHGYVVTDFSDAVGWLRMQTVRGELSSRQRILINDIGQTLDTEFKKGEVIYRCNDLSEVSEAVQIVGQAVLRVADLWFLFRHSVSESVSDEVEEWLQEREIASERNYKVRGRSTREWNVHFKTLVLGNTSFVFLLSTATRGAVHRITDQVFTGCSDLTNSQNATIYTYTPKLVSLFDDTVDVWRKEDFDLLENVSEIARWSSPDEFEHILKTPLSI